MLLQSCASNMASNIRTFGQHTSKKWGKRALKRDAPVGNRDFDSSAERRHWRFLWRKCLADRLLERPSRLSLLPAAAPREPGTSLVPTMPRIRTATASVTPIHVRRTPIFLSSAKATIWAERTTITRDCIIEHLFCLCVLFLLHAFYNAVVELRSPDQSRVDVLVLFLGSATRGLQMRSRARSGDRK